MLQFQTSSGFVSKLPGGSTLFASDSSVYSPCRAIHKIDQVTRTVSGGSINSIGFTNEALRKVPRLENEDHEDSSVRPSPSSMSGICDHLHGHFRGHPRGVSFCFSLALCLSEQTPVQTPDVTRQDRTSTRNAERAGFEKRVASKQFVSWFSW